MKKILLILALSLAAPLHAQESTVPSDFSIRELMAVTRAQRTLDTMYEQMEIAMKQGMAEGMPAELNDAQKKIFEEMGTKLMAVMKEELSWEKLEPTFIEVYRRTFTQDEVNGMLAFYRSEFGNALIEKMPTVMRTSTELMMEHVKAMMPRLQELQRDFAAQLKAAGK